MEIWVNGDEAEDVVDMAVGEDDDGGRGLLGRLARYFATISITPDHWVPSSVILEDLPRREEIAISNGLHKNEYLNISVLDGLSSLNSIGGFTPTQWFYCGLLSRSRSQLSVHLSSSSSGGGGGGVGSPQRLWTGERSILCS